MKQKDYTWTPEEELESLSDIQLVCYLAYKGFIVVSVDGRSKKAVFNFQRSESLTGAVERYWREDVTVDIKRFDAMMRQLKSRLYSAIR